MAAPFLRAASPSTAAQATFTTSALASGSHSISTTFTPTSGTPSTATLTQSVVAPAVTSTALSSSSNPASQGQSVTFTATVTSASGTPAGSVTFTDGATALASNVAVTPPASRPSALRRSQPAATPIVASFTGTPVAKQHQLHAHQTINGELYDFDVHHFDAESVELGIIRHLHRDGH